MTPTKYNIAFSITVDPDANFLEVDSRATLSVLYDLIEGAIYDIDDIEISELQIQED